MRIVITDARSQPMWFLVMSEIETPMASGPPPVVGPGGPCRGMEYGTGIPVGFLNVRASHRPTGGRREWADER